jgi:TPP-dependent pyruvate/acetoin dehydrogenase alpha subunit
MKIEKLNRQLCKLHVYYAHKLNQIWTDIETKIQEKVEKEMSKTYQKRDKNLVKLLIENKPKQIGKNKQIIRTQTMLSASTVNTAWRVL